MLLCKRVYKKLRGFKSRPGVQKHPGPHSVFSVSPKDMRLMLPLAVVTKTVTL